MPLPQSSWARGDCSAYTVQAIYAAYMGARLLWNNVPCEGVAAQIVGKVTKRGSSVKHLKEGDLVGKPGISERCRHLRSALFVGLLRWLAAQALAGTRAAAWSAMLASVVMTYAQTQAMQEQLMDLVEPRKLHLLLQPDHVVETAKQLVFCAVCQKD